MPLKRRVLGEPGLRYLNQYLSVGLPLADAARVALNVPGEVFTFLPEDTPDDVAALFSSARALHPAHAYTSVVEWAKAWTDPAYTDVPSGIGLLRGELERALAETPDAVLRYANDLGVDVEVPSPVGSDAIGSAITDGYVMATFVVTLADAAGCMRFIGVEAYDGEGFVAWRALGR